MANFNIKISHMFLRKNMANLIKPFIMYNTMQYNIELYSIQYFISDTTNPPTWIVALDSFPSAICKFAHNPKLTLIHK